MSTHYRELVYPEMSIAVWNDDNGTFRVDMENEEEYNHLICETLAEAYLCAAKKFHELGMNELQERINKL